MNNIPQIQIRLRDAIITNSLNAVYECINPDRADIGADVGADVSADVNFIYNNKITPLMIAIFYNETTYIAELLIEHGANVNYKTPTATLLDLAIKHGKDNMIKLLVNSGADVNSETDIGVIPLNYAVQNNLSANIIRFLIKNGADVNRPYNILHDENEKTPLILACKNKNPTLIRVLIQNGADPTIRNQKGFSVMDDPECNEIINKALKPLNKNVNKLIYALSGKRPGIKTLSEDDATYIALSLLDTRNLSHASENIKQSFKNQKEERERRSMRKEDKAGGRKKSRKQKSRKQRK